MAMLKSNLHGFARSNYTKPAERLSRLSRPKFDRVILVDDSEIISSIQYDTETSVLDAQLKTGQRYRYRNVAPVTFAHVVTAKSVGKAFNTYIRPLKHTKLPNR